MKDMDGVGVSKKSAGSRNPTIAAPQGTKKFSRNTIDSNTVVVKGTKNLIGRYY